ncbi:MAG: hypothetical protein ACREB9_08925, partial [Thermoplasmata archaeon]
LALFGLLSVRHGFDTLPRRGSHGGVRMRGHPQPDSAPPRRAGRDPRALLSFLGVPIAALLAVEFLLGMALNLFTTISGGSAVSILSSSPVLVAHIVIAVLLIGITARALALAIRIRERRGVSAAALGFVSGIVATLAGISYTFAAQSTAASYAMSVGFAGLFVSVVLLLLPRAALDGIASERRVAPGAPSPGDET